LKGFIDADPWGESPLKFLKNAEWILVRCADCGQVFHKMILSPEWNDRRFSSWMNAKAIKEFEERLSIESPLAIRTFKKAREHVAHILRIEKLTRPIRSKGESVRLLDFGCGWGEFLSVCSHFGFQAYGVDRSTPRIDHAVIKIFPSLADIEGLPSFHAITMFEVLEHLDDPASMLRDLSCLLVDGGLLVLETPDCRNVTSIATLEEYRKVHPLEHINAFTNETLKSIAERNRFVSISRGVSCVSADQRQIAKAEINQLLGRDGGTTRLYFRKA
jgi:SAM-dependent methyltransferase